MGTFTLVQSLTGMNLFLMPNADGCHIDLTPVGDTNNWECVDDPVATPDNDATYNYSTATDLNYDLYSLPNHTTETGTINYIQVFARAKSQIFPQHEDGIYKIIVTDNACGNIYKSNDINLTASSYKTNSKVWTENPRTVSAWTWDDIDNLQIGLECNSPTITEASAILTIRPIASGDITDLEPVGDTPNWKCVDDIISDGYTTYVWNSKTSNKEDLYHLTNHTTENDTITKIVVFAHVNAIISVMRGKTAIKIGGVTHYGDYVIIPTDRWDFLTTTYLINPTTSVAWTWDDIDNLQGGIYLEKVTGGYGCSCSQLYVAVYHFGTQNPEIRTTQEYVVVNYTPPDEECTLNKPEEISVNHSVNVKMLNFWDGTREVYGLNRSGKSIVLTGSEYQSDTCNKGCPCEHIQCIDKMGKNGSTIAISGLRSLFNGEFKIRSFGWKHISEKPEYYDWILELEYDD